jgi:hypothetical protein
MNMEEITQTDAKRRAEAAAQEFVTAVNGARASIEPYYPGFQRVWTVAALVPIFSRLLHQSYRIVPDHPTAGFQSFIAAGYCRCGLYLSHSLSLD